MDAVSVFILYTSTNMSVCVYIFVNKSGKKRPKSNGMANGFGYENGNEFEVGTQEQMKTLFL